MLKLEFCWLRHLAWKALERAGAKPRSSESAVQVSSIGISWVLWEHWHTLLSRPTESKDAAQQAPGWFVCTLNLESSGINSDPYPLLKGCMILSWKPATKHWKIIGDLLNFVTCLLNHCSAYSWIKFEHCILLTTAPSHFPLYALQSSVQTHQCPRMGHPVSIQCSATALLHLASVTLSSSSVIILIILDHSCLPLK